jgi:hypothetical protein
MNKCLVLYDELTSQDAEYRQRVIDITDFYIGTPQGFDLYRTSTLTETLKGLVDRGYQWAVVNTLGHCVDQHGVFTDIVDDCIANNHVLMAHLISGKAGYPRFDSQFFVINLPVWKELNCPPFELVPGATRIQTKKFTRSEENFHDDYTPFWIASSDEETVYHIHERAFGSIVTQKLIESGHTLVNFDRFHRTRKWNLYANTNESLLTPFFESGTLVYNETTLPQPQIIKRILQERDTLSSTVYVLNSEDISKHTPKMPAPIEHYVGVAGGFKGVLLLNKFQFTGSTKVTYVDVSDAALHYQKYLIDNWDGALNGYGDIVNTYQTKFPEYRCIWRSWNVWEEEIDLFLSQAGLTRAEFQSVWQQYQQLSHTFLKLDLLTSTDQFVDYIKSVESKYTYIWLSNAFDMQHTRFLFGKDYTNAKFEYLKTQLSGLGQHCIVESCGYFYKLN